MLAFDPPMSAGEYVRGETLPLATVFPAVMEILTDRQDAVVFGAHAVNSYLDEEKQRMTGDIDILSTDAASLAEEIRQRLHDRFHIATRVREMKGGQGYRVYQQRQPKPRHLVDVRQVAALPGLVVGHRVQFVEPVELLAMKTMSYVSRRNQPKGTTDLAEHPASTRSHPTATCLTRRRGVPPRGGRSGRKRPRRMARPRSVPHRRRERRVLVRAVRYDAVRLVENDVCGGREARSRESVCEQPKSHADRSCT